MQYGAGLTWCDNKFEVYYVIEFVTLAFKKIKLSFSFGIGISTKFDRPNVIPMYFLIALSFLDKLK